MRKRRLLILSISVILACSIALAFLLLSPSHGSLQVRVVDVFTAAPIENARIVIVEANKEAFTTSKGFTEALDLPVLTYGNMLPIKKDFGELTLIAYAEGYLDLALFRIIIEPNKLRNVTLYLFPDDGSTNGEPVSMVEAPNMEWIKMLIEKCR